jgi:hypothetical protein
MSIKQIPFLLHKVTLAPNTQTEIPLSGDFLSYIKVVDNSGNPIDPNLIQIDVGSGLVPMASILPAKMIFNKVVVKNTATVTANIDFLIGFETSSVLVQNINVAQDFVGLVKTADITKSKALNFKNVNVGTTPTQITSTSTPINLLLIQNNSASDVYFGNSTTQNIKIPANGGSIQIVLPLAFTIDLSTLYLISSTAVTVAVMYA